MKALGHEIERLTPLLSRQTHWSRADVLGLTYLQIARALMALNP